MFDKEKKIVVIGIKDTITGSNSGFRDKYDHYSILSKLNKVKEDENVVGVVVTVNSPGGTAGASWELYKCIMDLNEVKPVYASVSDSACSGAYMAILGCTRIYCSVMSMIGSIGVIMQVPNLKEFGEKHGIYINTAKSGKFKDIGNPFREMTEEEHRYLQDTIERDHLVFSNLVLKHRKIDTDKFTELTDGRFFVGAEALELNLVDEIGSLWDCANALKEKTGADEIEYRVQPKGILNKILAKLSTPITVSLEGLFPKVY